VALAHRGSAFAVIGSVVVSNYSRDTRRIKLQQNLRVIGRCDRLDDVEVAFFHRHLGAELNAMMARHTASDTTRESPCVQRVRGTRAPDAVGRENDCVRSSPTANILLSSRGRKRLPLSDIQTRMYL
jgi:hypothetical protein